MNDAESNKTKELYIDDPLYPALLRQIPDPPQKLYYKGEITENSFNNCLSVVGSRRITSYGERACELLTTATVKAGLNIVSGFAVGVDIFALKSLARVKKEYSKLNMHEKSVPIIVLPAGFGWVSPIENLRYLEPFLKIGGIFLTEYEYGHRAFKWTYPKRNRIIAALSRATLVIEAEIGGGTMNTAQHCLRYGRKLLAVPGEIDKRNSEGCNLLIKNGANLIDSPEDILIHYNRVEALNVNSRSFIKRDDLSPVQNQIISKLLYSSYQIDELSREVGLGISELNVELSNLQLKDLIYNNEGKFHAR